MKYLCFLALSTFVGLTCFSQDTCKASFNGKTENLDGFTPNVRLDGHDSSFLSSLNLETFRFTNDYVGALRNPGVLFNELDFSGFELLSTNLTFSDKNNAQKIVFSPFRLNNDQKSNVLLNTRFNVALKNNITTLGLAIGGDNSEPRLKKFEALREAVFSRGQYLIPECFGTKLEQDRARQINEAEAKRLLFEFDSLRTKHVVKWSIGYNTQLFGVLSSKGDDPVTDSLNYYGLKSHNISGQISYSINNGQWSFSGGYNYIISRKNSEKGQNKIPYHGFAFSGGYRAISFLKGDKLKANDNYLKFLYVPSLNLGLAYELKTTNGDIKFAEDGIKTGRVITPFIDILISPAAQFRIGFPITHNKTVLDKKTSELGALLQYSFKLSSL
jgi:hypothetical protein